MSRLIVTVAALVAVVGLVELVMAVAADPADRDVLFVLLTIVIWACLVAVGLLVMERRERRRGTTIVGYRVSGSDPSRARAWSAAAMAVRGSRYPASVRTPRFRNWSATIAGTLLSGELGANAPVAPDNSALLFRRGCS